MLSKETVMLRLWAVVFSSSEEDLVVQTLMKGRFYRESFYNCWGMYPEKQTGQAGKSGKIMFSNCHMKT